MTRRQSIHVEGFGHKNPIPAACRVGDVLMSGIVYGLDPETGKPAETLDAQCALMFRHIRSIMQEAGGSTDDIVKVTVWLSDRSQREQVNLEWLAMFPDPANRPARQAMAGELDGGKLIQCDFVAVMEGRG
ncbi:RidA family protein [Bosea sp. NBC_00550]|uniref:RidA family protein n=1 Tax=Bosea sp. NBC_00550 TaxID=2969621 RepID=UPI00222EABE5|nr:RidA family protein [Bosea sp. NBC_00550]UZF94710.1 RidA family protein [Bosea sp. NBC_00550]